MSRVQLARTALATITTEAAAAADGHETGGVLLGSDDGTVLKVRRAGGPGPRADRRASGFRRDLVHAQELALAAWAADESVWVGDWHTHPRRPARPSATDLATYNGLLGDPTLGFRRFCAIIVTPANGVDCVGSRWRRGWSPWKGCWPSPLRSADPRWPAARQREGHGERRPARTAGARPAEP